MLFYQCENSLPQTYKVSKLNHVVYYILFSLMQTIFLGINVLFGGGQISNKSVMVTTRYGKRLQVYRK